MDILKVFKLNTNEYDVLIQGTIDKPLFLASDIGKILDIKTIRTSIHDFSEKEKTLCPVKTEGGIQNRIFLTERGLYKVINRSNKPIAQTFQDWVLDIIEEIRNTGKYELKENNIIEKFYNKRNEEEKIHNALIQLFDKKNVVYLGKVGEAEDGSIYVKIGCSDDIKTRSPSLLTQFGQFVILELFECSCNNKFEKFLHDHNDISKCNIKNYKNTNSKEIFLFNEESYKKLLNIIKSNIDIYRKYENKIELEKISLEEKKIDKNSEIKLKKMEYDEKKRKDEMEERKKNLEMKEKIRKDELQERKRENDLKEKLINLISSNTDVNFLNIFSSSFLNEIKNNKEKVNKDENNKEDENSKEDDKNIDKNIKDNIKENNQYNNQHNNDIKEENDEDNDSKYDINTNNVSKFLDYKNRPNVKSPIVQQYDPEKLEYITSFDSIIDTVRFFRENYHIDNFSDSTLRASARGNYVYAGYRWNLVDRDTEDKPYVIPPTEIILNSRRELIARLNLDKNKILEVYSSQKEAAISMKLKAPASLCNAIKRGTTSQGHYWNFYDDCSEELKEDFIKNNGIIPKAEKVISGSKGIKQIHPFTKEVLEIFPTIKEVQLKFKMSRDTLKKAIEQKKIYNYFYWAYA